MATPIPNYQEELVKNLRKTLSGLPTNLSTEERLAIADTAATGKYATKGLGATLPQLSRDVELNLRDNKNGDYGGTLNEILGIYPGMPRPTITGADLDERLSLTIGGRYSKKTIYSNLGFMEAGRSFGSTTLADKISMHLACNILAKKYGIIVARNTGEGGALPWELFGKHMDKLSEAQKEGLYKWTEEILEYNHITFKEPEAKRRFIELLYQREYPLIVQSASGMFWQDPEYLLLADGTEIKTGQGAKIGHGGLLPAEKVDEYVAFIRGIMQGIAARSPARQLHILGPENMTRYVLDLRENNEWELPIIIKVGASYVDADTKIIIKSCADAAAIDGLTGSTGAAPKKVQNDIGVTTEVAAVMARRAAEEFFGLAGYDPRFKIIISGGINDYEQILKARSLAGGSDAGVAMGTSWMVAANCVIAMTCNTNCELGITTNPERYPIIENAERIVNYTLAQAYAENRLVKYFDRLPTKDDLRARTNVASVLLDLFMKDGRKYSDKAFEHARALVSQYNSGMVYSPGIRLDAKPTTEPATSSTTF